jgi:hypothetical protein
LETKEIPLPQILRDNAPRNLHTVESLSFKAADVYHRSGNKEKMMAALGRLPNLKERTDFLIRKSYIEEAALLFQEAGRWREIVIQVICGEVFFLDTKCKEHCFAK